MRNIWTLDPFVFKPTTSGLSVFGLVSEALVNFIPLAGGINSVWADEQYVYLGTSVSGIYRCPTSTVSGATTLTPYKTYPDITSNEVNYIHGKGDYLCATTASGVDRYKVSTDDREYVEVAGPGKCFQTSNGDYYYVVNRSLPVELEDNLYNWKYAKTVELSHPTEVGGAGFTFEIPMTQPDEIYVDAAVGGADIRLISDSGEHLPFYITRWNLVDPPQILVKLPAGLSKFYILYGNGFVSSVEDRVATYEFYEDFDGTELNTDLWEFNNGGYSNNVYRVEDSKFIFDSYHNDYNISLKSKVLFNGGVFEHSFRRTSGTQYVDDMDYQVSLVNGGIFTYIGCANNDTEFPHYFNPQTGGDIIYGTKLASTEFKVLTVVESLHYQSSEYDGEILVSSGTLTNGSAPRALRFLYNSYYNRPDIEIDWVGIRNYDPNPPTYSVSVGRLINEVFNSCELHAVYNSGGGFVYTGNPGNVLDATYINDIYVTEGTSNYNNDNVIFVATIWGAMVIEEQRGNELESEKRVFLIES